MIGRPYFLLLTLHLQLLDLARNRSNNNFHAAASRQAKVCPFVIVDFSSAAAFGTKCVVCLRVIAFTPG